MDTPPKRIFVTGIGTEVGKTLLSAILVEALEADYFKPIQAGDLDQSDTHRVRQLVSNPKSTFYPSTYALSKPMSPHAAAQIDGIYIDPKSIDLPNTENHLIVEGAGGLLVPINDSQTIFDLIPKDFEVVVVSRHYLGSINHTLLTLELLKQQKMNFSLVFNGDKHQSTEGIIQNKTGVNVLGRIDTEPYFDQEVIRYYANIFREKFLAIK